MRRLSAFLLVCLLAAPALAGSNVQVHRQQTNIPPELQAPLAAVLRMATGLEANKTCNQLAAPDLQLFKEQMTAGVRGLYERLADSGLSAAKAERILRQLMDNGEKMAQSNFPTCTTLASDIIVKATQDAACINPYLAGQDTACFR